MISYRGAPPQAGGVIAGNCIVGVGRHGGAEAGAEAAAGRDAGADDTAASARRELSIGIYLDNYASGWRVEDNAVLGAMSDRVCADRHPRISLARGHLSRNI